MVQCSYEFIFSWRVWM